MSLRSDALITILVNYSWRELGRIRIVDVNCEVDESLENGDDEDNDDDAVRIRTHNSSSSTM